MAEWLLSGPRLVGVLGGSSEQSPQNPTPPPLPPHPRPSPLANRSHTLPTGTPASHTTQDCVGRKGRHLRGAQNQVPRACWPRRLKAVRMGQRPHRLPGSGVLLHSHSDPCPTDSPWQAGRRQAGGGAQPTTQWCGPSGREGADLPGAGTPQPAPPSLWTFLSAVAKPNVKTSHFPFGTIWAVTGKPQRIGPLSKKVGKAVRR